MTAVNIEDEANTIAVSVASVGEVAIKSRLLRRDAIGMSAGAFVDLIDVHARHAVEVERLPHLHGDPFDRLLVATAYADTCRLMTSNRALSAYGDHVLLV